MEIVTLGWEQEREEWEDALARSTQPPEDPIAYTQDCEAMGE